MLMTGLGRDSVYQAINDGHLRAKKCGTRTIITAHALNVFLDSLPDAGQANGKTRRQRRR